MLTFGSDSRDDDVGRKDVAEDLKESVPAPGAMVNREVPVRKFEIYRDPNPEEELGAVSNKNGDAKNTTKKSEFSYYFANALILTNCAKSRSQSSGTRPPRRPQTQKTVRKTNTFLVMNRLPVTSRSPRLVGVC